MIIRKGCAEDLPLVYDSWVNSYRGSYFAEGMKHAGLSYSRFQDMLIKNILGRDSSSLTVAVWDSGGDGGDDADAPVVGWACTEGSVLHYVWVRTPWRGPETGVARALLGDLGQYTTATHKTRALPNGMRQDWMRVWA